MSLWMVKRLSFLARLQTIMALQVLIVERTPANELTKHKEVVDVFSGTKS